MAGATVRCPQCDKSFRIADRQLLGRTGKCSSCGNRFKLAAEESKRPPGPTPSVAPRSPSRSAEKTASKAVAPARPRPSQPLVGVNARWVPDEPAEPIIRETVAPAARPDDDDIPDIFASPATTSRPASRVAQPLPRPVSDPEDATDTASPAAQRRRKKQRQQRTLMGGLAALAAAIVTAVLLMPSNRGPAESTVTDAPVVPVAPPDAALPYSRTMLEGNVALLDEFRPTNGQPIDMRFVPNGVNLVIHLRPAELWGQDRAAAELRASLTEGVVSWLESAIKTHCRREPSQVAEATFVFVLGAFGTQPQSGVVVRLKEPAQQSALVEEFKGKIFDDSSRLPLTTNGEFAYVIADSQTFAIGPAVAAVELQDSLKTPNGYVSRTVESLLKTTDRDRLLTIVADLPDLRRHVDTLIPPAARSAVTAILDEFGDDVESLSWSLHPKPAMHSEFTVLPVTGVPPRALRETLRQRLDSLPTRLVALTKSLNPAQQGFRQMIGRFPAMVEAFREATILHANAQSVRATTVLPSRAVPNLALAALLTWDEQQRRGTTSSSPAATVAASGALPAKVADRLKLEVLAELNRVPIEQAVIYIGDAVGVKFVVDGEALRAKGYTRNMPQTMSLGRVPAVRALKEIISVPNQSDLAIDVNESDQTAILTTKAALQQQGKQAFPLE